MRKTRTKYLAGAALAAICFALCFLSFDLGHNWGDDFAQYIAQAMALWDGNIPAQLAANGFIVSHTPLGLGPVAYPWGFPLMLAPVYGAFGFNLAAFKLVGVACCALFVFFVFLYYEKRLGGLWAAALSLLFAVNPAIVRSTNEICSDIPFLLFSTLSLMAMEALLAGGAPRRQWAMGALTGLLLLAAFLIRTNGLVLVLALASAQALTLPNWRVGRWFRRGGAPGEKPLWRAQALPYLIFIPCYLLIGRLLPGGGESHLQYASLVNLQRIRENALYYATLMKEFFPLSRGKMTLYLALVALFALGAVRQARRHPLPLIYLMGTLALYVLWPSRQGLRFLYPALPVFLLFAALGIRELAALAARSRAALAERAALLLALCLCAALCASAVRTAAGNLARGRAAADGAYGPVALAAYDCVRRNTPEGAVIAFRKPRALYLNARRLSFALGADIGRLKDADYLLIASGVPGAAKQITELYTLDEMRARFGVSLELQYRDPDLALYRVGEAP